MMGKIAVFDDCIEEAKMLRNKLKYYLGDEEVFIKTSFDYEFLNNNTIDLLFLDIELNNCNGIVESEKMKFVQKRKINIIFVSNHDTYLQDSMSVRPIYYVRKNNLDKDLKSAFNILMINNFRVKRKLFDGTLVNMEQLMCVESDKHYLFYHFEDGSVLKERAKLDDCEKGLISNVFVRCHKSHIVNFGYVDMKVSDIFLLKNKEHIKISRRYIDDVTRKWHEYIVNIR